MSDTAKNGTVPLANNPLVRQKHRMAAGDKTDGQRLPGNGQQSTPKTPA